MEEPRPDAEPVSITIAMSAVPAVTVSTSFTKPLTRTSFTVAPDFGQLSITVEPDL